MASLGDASLRTDKVLQKVSEVDDHVLHKARQLIQIEAKLNDVAIDIDRNELDHNQVPVILKTLKNVLKSITSVQDKCVTIGQTASKLVDILNSQHGDVSATGCGAGVHTSSPVQEEGKDKKKDLELDVGPIIDDHHDIDDEENVDGPIDLRAQTGNTRKGTVSGDSGVASMGSIPSSTLSLRLEDVMEGQNDDPDADDASPMNDLNRTTGGGSGGGMGPDSVSDEDNTQTPPVDPPRASAFLQTLKPSEQELLTVQGRRHFKKAQCGLTQVSRDQPTENNDDDRLPSAVSGTARATSLPSDLMRSLLTQSDGTNNVASGETVRDPPGSNDDERNSSVVSGQTRRTSSPPELCRHDMNSNDTMALSNAHQQKRLRLKQNAINKEKVSVKERQRKKESYIPHSEMSSEKLKVHREKIAIDLNNIYYGQKA